MLNKNETKNYGESMKFAVASSDGDVVDVHFGKATSFYIYSKNEEHKLNIMTDRRTIPTYCQGDDVKDSHTYDSSRIEAIVDIIKDCEAIYVKKIGDKPKLELENRKIKVVEYHGLVAEI